MKKLSNMRLVNFSGIALVFLFLVFSCDDPYNDEVDESDADYVTNDPWQPPSALDTWLLDNFTYPYNIEVKYHWDASEGDIYRTLVPPMVSQVQPVMDVVRDAWITPYSELAGGAFIKKYCPKQFLLIGSARYNIDGTFTLGTAEGGRKVVLYVVNDFSSTSRSALQDLLHIVHHEFTHILNQRIPYPAAFREVTPGSYTGDWRFFSTGQARSSGFITNYAMASPEEDFAEMVATMLLLGKEGYEKVLACEAASAYTVLKRKEEFVLQYFREAFGFDFYALQAEVQEALDTITPPPPSPVELPPLSTVWGYDKDKTTVRFDLTRLNQPGNFIGRYNLDNHAMHEAGLALDYNFKIYFTAGDVLTLKLYYHDLMSDPRVYQEANFFYYAERNPDGSIHLYLEGGDENGQYLVNELKAGALATYFSDRTFNIDWLESCTGEFYVAFYPVAEPQDYCYGTLED